MNGFFLVVFFAYQRFMWFVLRAGEELGKPLRFYSEVALLVLLFERFGFSLSWFWWVVLYFFVLVFAGFFGFLLQRFGVVAYNSRLSNRESPELMSVLERVKRIEDEVCGGRE